jgi:hypothetical protein
MQCSNISAPHKLISVAAREAENLCDFRHREQTFGRIGLVIIAPLLIGVHQTRCGKSSEHRCATGDQDASRRFRYTCR